MVSRRVMLERAFPPDPPLDPRPTRFFARVWALDLECPRCGKIHVIRAGRAGSWDGRLSRFKCSSCGLCLQIGIIAYSLQRGRGSPPSDTVPTPRQAAELREHYRGRWEHEKIGKSRGIRVNRVIEEGEGEE